MDEEARVKKDSAYDEACFLSKMFNLWIIPLFNKGWHRTIGFDDIYCCRARDHPLVVADRLEEAWNEELSQVKSGRIKKPNAMRAVIRAFGWQWFWTLIPVMIDEAGIRLIQPFLIERIVRFLAQDPGDESSDRLTKSDAQVYAVILILITGFLSSTRHYFFLVCFNLGLRIRAALTVLIYRKILKASKASEEQMSAGRVLNMMANDLYRFQEVSKQFFSVLVGPVMAGVVLYFTYSKFGPNSFGGFIIMILFIPFQGIMGRLFTRFRRRTTHITDQRVNMMSEILSAMKMIKVSCWEDSFAEVVDGIRKQEIRSIRKTFSLRGINSAVAYVCTRLMLFFTLLTYVLSGGLLSSPAVFLTMSLYQSLQTPLLKNFTNAVGSGAEAMVATRRVTDMLLLPEKQSEEDSQSDREKRPKGSIELRNYSAKWNETLTRNSLSNLNLSVSPGELLMIVGSVGAGKTCFLWSLLQEIMRTSGLCEVTGSISYSPQDNWCFGSSVKNNILVGQPFNRQRYDSALRASCLNHDLRSWPDGDESFVGEKGFTLSGGQKARLTLARAVYRDADVYLLDDPLSAVDPKVGNNIFRRCIKQYLTGKTVVLVTHQLQFMPQAHKVLLLREGEVAAFGSYAEVSQSQEMQLFVSQKLERKESLADDSRSRSATKTSTEETSDEEVEDCSDIQPEANESVNKNEMRSEKQETGSVPWSVVWKYLTAGGQSWLLILTILVSCGSQGLYHFSDLWLSAWISQYYENRNSSETVVDPTLIRTQSFNIPFYCGLIGILFGSAFLRSLLTFALCTNSSVKLHDNTFKRVLRTKMRFFEITPLGRILNRFTKDTGVIDQDLPLNIVEMNMNVVSVIGVIVTTVVVSYWLLIPCLILFVLAVLFRTYYIRTARDLQRLDAIVRSPVYSHVTTTLEGLVSIRAFCLQDRMNEQYIRYVTDFVSSQFMIICASRLIAVMLDMMVWIYISCVTLACLWDKNLAPGDAGVILSSSMALTGIFQYSLKLTTDFEQQIVSLERVFEYERLEPEDLEKQGTAIHKDWPKRGEIFFKDVNLAYDNSSPLVLKDVTFKVEAGTRVGVVGRTGAGKSSLIALLFRLTECSSGKVVIDGTDTKSLSLRQLRENISLIPQEPSLFCGSIRRNLDPFCRCDSDEKIWQALRDVHLSEAVLKMQLQLETHVAEKGSNLSSGQRQLLCLARALLSRNRILVLDEATANVDLQTDSYIQQVIRSKFAGQTVITVAHRLDTIIDSGFLLVLDAGRLVESGPPHLLLQDKTSAFFSMVEETGEQFSKRLRAAAAKSFGIHQNGFVEALKGQKSIR